MAKGIRSKCKRASRTEFRKTIGEEFAQKQMNIIQSKLQECVTKGNMNSFEKLSNMLSTTHGTHGTHGTNDTSTGSINNLPALDVEHDSNPEDPIMQDIDQDIMNDSGYGSSSTKQSNKIPVKKSSLIKNTKRKQYLPKTAGLKRKGKKSPPTKKIRRQRRPRRSFI